MAAVSSTSSSVALTTPPPIPHTVVSSRLSLSPPSLAPHDDEQTENPGRPEEFYFFCDIFPHLFLVARPLQLAVVRHGARIRPLPPSLSLSSVTARFSLSKTSVRGERRIVSCRLKGKKNTTASSLPNRPSAKMAAVVIDVGAQPNLLAAGD